MKTYIYIYIEGDDKYIYIYIYLFIYTHIGMPVVPHKAVTELSKIGNLYRRGELL